MVDDSKLFGPRLALAGWWALVASIIPIPSGQAAAPITLKVEVSDGLPGFHGTELPAYLASQMREAGLSDWRFEPAETHGAARDRVQWTFKLNPYAGGEVRNFVRTVVNERRFVTRRPITIEARLYLNGEYQTLVEKQAIIHGGPDDPELAAAVASTTQYLLGRSGAYRAVDSGPRPQLR